MPMGPIQISLGNRVIYDSRLPRSTLVASIIQDNRWHWPLANSPELISLKEVAQNIPPPSSNSKDTVLWSPSHLGQYSTKSAWNTFRETRSIVSWSNIWFPGKIPKASFILWLVVKKKLNTQDRLFNSIPNAECLLCNSQLETHDHLYFECPVSK